MDDADRERYTARCSQLWASGTSWRRYARTWDDRPSVWRRLAARLRRTR